MAPDFVCRVDADGMMTVAGPATPPVPAAAAGGDLAAESRPQTRSPLSSARTQTHPFLPRLPVTTVSSGASSSAMKSSSSLATTMTMKSY